MNSAQTRELNAVFQSGWQRLADHFVDVNKMIESGPCRLLTFLTADHFPETGKMVEIQKYAEA